MGSRFLLAAFWVAACAPAEIKWSVVDPDELEPSLRSLSGCVGDTDCVVVIDLRCHAFALNKRHAQAWYNRPIDDETLQNPAKCMPPKGETLYAPKCGQRGLCVAVPP